ncbi:GPI alpha-mannosyltransferase III [Trypanosoma brucei equiperdum]|uniref:Mannosyltransferase n=1 Tax=Trypanosoma brucei equiperdum TaxID=630700 RepID=A0A3L6KXD1_9TRYP|nr:GPI alpha-mannosyltransferase III [Trypanosoma brucei equiperdum]
MKRAPCLSRSPAVGSAAVILSDVASDSIKPYMPWWLISLTFIYRLFLCATIRTVEAPDEWWQSTEVAYNMVFGKGHLPWEWRYGLRSVLFPAVVALPFYLLKLLGRDTTWAVWFAPRVLQALVLTLIDVSVFCMGATLDELLAKRELELAEETRQSKTKGFSYFCEVSVSRSRRGICNSISYTALLLSLSNWYMAYCGVRLYGNVIEALLVLLTLQQRRYVPFLLLTGLASAIRVTSAVVLSPLVFRHLANATREHGFIRGLFRIVLTGLIVLVAVLGGVMVLDYCFYGRWVLTPLAFFRFNVLHNLSRFFGEHPWYFYVGPVLVGIVGPHVLFTIAAPLVLWRDTASRAVSRPVLGMLGIGAWTLGFYSLIDHKEMRFVFVVIPLSLITAAFVLVRWSRASAVVVKMNRLFVLFNIVMIYLMGYVYRRGPLDVMAEVRDGPRINRLDVIATCYTVPGYSYMHKKVNHLGFVDCSIDLDEKTGLPKVTEDIMFRRYPKEYVLWRYDGKHSFNMSDLEESRKASELQSVVMPKSAPHPDAMVMTRAVAKEIEEPFLKRHGYRLYRTFLHSPLTLAPYEDIYIQMWVKVTK